MSGDAGEISAKRYPVLISEILPGFVRKYVAMSLWRSPRFNMAFANAASAALKEDLYFCMTFILFTAWVKRRRKVVEVR